MFYLNSGLSATAQQISLRNSGMASLATIAPFPMNLIITRVSDGAKEVVRCVSQISATDGIILRAQDGSTGLVFLAGDGVDVLPLPVNLPIAFAYLGSPALGTPTFMRAAVALTGSPQTGLVVSANPDVARCLSATANASGVVGNTTFHGQDMLGNALSEAVTLAGTATVYTLNAFYGPITYDLPVQTHVGTDTVSVGVGPALGIPNSLPRNTVTHTYLNNVKEATPPTVNFGASIGANTITLSSALNGTPVSFYFING